LLIFSRVSRPVEGAVAGRGVSFTVADSAGLAGLAAAESLAGLVSVFASVFVSVFAASLAGLAAAVGLALVSISIKSSSLVTCSPCFFVQLSDQTTIVGSNVHMDFISFQSSNNLVFSYVITNSFHPFNSSWWIGVNKSES